MAHGARPETLLTVLAGTLEMLAQELEQLPDRLRANVGGPRPRTLRSWRERVVAQRDAIRAAAGPLPPPAPDDATGQPDAGDGSPRDSSSPATHNPTGVEQMSERKPEGGPPGQADKPGHPQGGPPGQTGDHPQGGPPGQTGDKPQPGQPHVEHRDG